MTKEKLLSCIKVGAVLTVLFVLMFAVLSKPPASDYLTTKTVMVHDGCGGDELQVDADGQILQAFDGNYRSWFIDAEGDNMTTPPIWRGRLDSIPYRPGEAYSNLKSLNWWAYPTSGELPPGKYQMVTEWRIYISMGRFIEKELTSNLFEILDCAHD